MPDPALDLKLLPIFLAEADALLVRCADCLGRLQAAPGDPEALARLRHALHTLKGLAHMVGADELAEATLREELCIKAIAEGAGDAVPHPRLVAGLRHIQALLGPLRPLAAHATPAPAPEPLGIEALAERLGAVVRQGAQALGKRVQLEIRGHGVPFEPTLLAALTPPLEHLLRNAVAHGIETPEARIRAGKPDTGRVLVEAIQAGAGRTLCIEDDGAGIDLAAVRARGAALGWTAEAPEELQEWLFRPGFSTAPEAHHVAGLGVGLDAVREAVRGLEGYVDLTTEPGRGSRFYIRLPY